MKLDFSLLVVDDTPDNVGNAIQILTDHLKAKGFSLKKEIPEDLSEQGIEELARTQGRNYDLVMVDYHLGQDGPDGASVARQLRQKLEYVDMVFYSSASVSQLLEHLAKHEVSGVFAERREDLSDALTGLADTVIGKAVDLNHMRGIAMAEVAGMDVLMEETLVRVFESNNEQIDAAKSKTIERLNESMDKNSRRLQERLGDGGLPAVVRDSLLFTLASKYRTIKRVAKYLPDTPQKELQIVGSYNEDIIQNRNMLAHAKEDTNDDGKPVLRFKGRDQKEVIIDDEWMSELRRKLHIHMSALNTICVSLDEAFGEVRTTDKTE